MITKLQDRIAAAAFMTWLVGGLTLAAVTKESDELPVIDRTETECITDSECAALEFDQVLVGTGCGPDGATSYAREEDEFAYEHCDQIELHRVVGEWSTDAGTTWRLVVESPNGQVTMVNWNLTLEECADAMLVQKYSACERTD